MGSRRGGVMGRAGPELGWEGGVTAAAAVWRVEVEAVEVAVEAAMSQASNACTVQEGRALLSRERRQVQLLVLVRVRTLWPGEWVVGCWGLRVYVAAAAGGRMQRPPRPASQPCRPPPPQHPTPHTWKAGSLRGCGRKASAAHWRHVAASGPLSSWAPC